MTKDVKLLFMFLIFGLGGLLVYGCATGAKVIVNDQYKGRTPTVVCLERDKTYRIVLQRGGDEDVMNINVRNVRTDSYRPNFFGAEVFVNMKNDVVGHGITTLDGLKNLNFQREININIPPDKDSVSVRFVTEDNPPVDIANEELGITWLLGCQGKKGKEKIKPLLLKWP